MDKKESIIILWDFTETADNALLHAVQLAKGTDNTLVLFNVVSGGGLFGSKSKVEENRKNLEQKLNAVKEEIIKKHNITPDVVVSDNGVAKGLKEVYEQTNANLLIMGKEFISEAGGVSFKDILKYSTDLNLPVIQINSKPSHSKYSEIVVPLDHNKKYKEKLHWIIFLSKYYNFNVNIIKAHSSDDLLKKQMSNNVFFTKKMLDNKKIVYGIKTAKKQQSFSDEILRFAHDIEADLIVVMTPEYNSYIQKSNGVENPTVPIMCINPRPDLQKFAGFR